MYRYVQSRCIKMVELQTDRKKLNEEGSKQHSYQKKACWTEDFCACGRVCSIASLYT